MQHEIIIHKDEEFGINEIQLIVEGKAFIAIPLYENEPLLRLGKYLEAYRTFDGCSDYILIEVKNGKTTETACNFNYDESSELMNGRSRIANYNEIAPFYNLPEISKGQEKRDQI